jgi:hypothetical protein
MEEREPIELHWKSCPASMHPSKAALAWFVIAMVAVVVSSNSIILGILLTALLIATQGAFLFPTKYSITTDGLMAKSPMRRKFYTWDKIRRATFFKEVCCVFTRVNPSCIDGWSAMSIFYGPNRDEVVAALKSHLREDVAT